MKLAERRPPGFTVALRFYDSEEVLSIPRRLRCEAVGAWTLCGSYSANQLTDGYVSDEKLKQLGVRPAIRDALMVTTPEPLWIPATNGDGIQFTRWSKWQRTSTEIRSFREKDAERKRVGRLQAKHPPSWECSDMSARTQNGRTSSVQVDHRDPKPEPKPEPVNNSPTEEHSLNVGTERGLTDAVNPSASRLVATVIPDRFPAAVRTALRLQASQLMNGDGIDADVVADALRRWLTKPDVGPGLLPALAADVIRARAAPVNGKSHKLRSIAELAQRERVREQAELPSAHQPKGIA